MAAFSVTTAEMTKKISDLRAKNQSLKQQVSKMKESKDELNTTWDGNAKKNVPVSGICASMRFISVI